MSEKMEIPPISPQEAVQILDHATKNYQGNRQQHQMIAQSLSVLSKFVEANTPKETKSEKTSDIEKDPEPEATPIRKLRSRARPEPDCRPG